MIKVICLIAGGALGTLFRYSMSTWVQRFTFHSFPVGILSVNVIGSFLIGLCWSIAETCQFSSNLRAFLFVGLFGGFTTFSSYSLDTLVLFKTGAYKTAFLNIIASNILGLIAVYSGVMTGKSLTSLFK